MQEEEEKKLVPFSYFSAATQSNDGRSFVGEGLMLLLLLSIQTGDWLPRSGYMDNSRSETGRIRKKKKLFGFLFFFYQLLLLGGVEKRLILCQTLSDPRLLFT